MSDSNAVAVSSVPAPVSKPPRAKPHRLTRAEHFRLDTWVVANREKIEAGEWTLAQMADILTDGDFKPNAMHVRQACRTFNIKPLSGGRRGNGNRKKGQSKSARTVKKYRRAMRSICQQLAVFRDKLAEVGVTVELNQHVTDILANVMKV